MNQRDTTTQQLATLKETAQMLDTILSREQKRIFTIINYVFLCTMISLFGIVTNIINIVVFYKQGLNISINITFFAMAISDLCSLLFQQWLSVCENPWFEESGVPMVPSEFQYTTGGAPRVVFSKITCLITVYTTLERCLCITFPLHIKQIITPRRTTIIMIGIYTFVILSVSPLYWSSYIDWKYYPDRNKTLLGLIFIPNSEHVIVAVYIMQGFIGLGSFISVVILTAVLANQLAKKSTWRKSANADSDKSDSMSARDRKTISMVVLIASILIICYTPECVIHAFTFIVPEFNITSRFAYLYLSTWSIACVLETINSSVNIILYMKMSTKYREAFRELFGLQKPT